MIRLLSKRLLVPTDFSPESEKALHEAFGLVEDVENVTVLHVAPPLESYAVADPAIVWESVSDEDRREKLTRSFRDGRSAAGAGDYASDPRRADVDFQVVFGHPAHEIAQFAEQRHFDLIVMPSHGRTGFQRLLSGSVAEHVVRESHCPVLVLKE